MEFQHEINTRNSIAPYKLDELLHCSCFMQCCDSKAVFSVSNTAQEAVCLCVPRQNSRDLIMIKVFLSIETLAVNMITNVVCHGNSIIS